VRNGMAVRCWCVCTALAYTGRYFDAPGCSLLTQASIAGFLAVALTRPAYPADEHAARRHRSFTAAAAVIAKAITDVWNQFGAPVRALC
jgi:hypothetical protein